MVLGLMVNHIGPPIWAVAFVGTVLLAGLAFLLYQLVRWPFRRWGDLGWLIAGVGIYWMLRFPLVAGWQSLVFLGLVWLNLRLVFRTNRIDNARLIFFDMTLCYLISLVLGVYCMEPSAAVLNVVILTVLVAGYVAASRGGRFNRPSQRSARAELPGGATANGI